MGLSKIRWHLQTLFRSMLDTEENTSPKCKGSAFGLYSK